MTRSKLAMLVPLASTSTTIPSVIYVNTFTDSLESMSFRDAIIEANGAGAPRTIILDSGNFVIDIPVAADPMSTFPNATTEFCGATDPTTMWSDQDSGDFDITGTINIVGNHANLTELHPCEAIDRVFKVHPGGSLTLSRLTVTGGVSPPGQGGGGDLICWNTFNS